MINSQQSRRHFLKKIGLGLLSITTSSVYAKSNVKKQPNIILFIGDDISWNDLCCYGNTVIKTPNIDRIAKQGIKFTNVFLTASSCSPSRCSIIAGRYPHNTGAAELHTPLPAELPIFPVLLKKQGYYTVQAGKWHMGPHARRGFDHIYDKRKENGDGGEEKWLECIQNRPKDKPFFAWFASHDAHSIWGPNDYSGTHKPANVKTPPYLVNAKDTKKDLAAYYDEIFRFDSYIGQIEKELERQGILENTLIMIMADNGRPFPRCKTRVYDSGMKTPFVIKWTGSNTKKGADCHSLISSIDIAPTLLHLAGADIPSSFQGKSFHKILQNPESPFRKYIFSEHNWHDHEAHERMLRTKDYLYVLNSRAQFSNQGPADSIHSLSFKDLKTLRDQGELTSAQADVFVTPRPREELFDCRNDSHQLVNVASLEKYQTKLVELRNVMTDWQQETKDDTPDNLTKDWYDRETGDALDVERNRGVMPGAKTDAIKTNASGPF